MNRLGVKQVNEKTKPPLILHGQGAAHYVMQFRIIRLRALLWEPLPQVPLLLPQHSSLKNDVYA